MLVVNPTPFGLPLNSANVRTESVETQNQSAVRIPQSEATFEIPNQKATETEQKSSAAERNAKSFELRDNYIASQGETKETGTTEEKPQVIQQNQSSEQASQARAEQEQLAQDQAIISNLSSIDRKVRAHEQAHASVGGSLTGAPSYTFKTGPNGVRYAVAGEVSIDTSGVPGNPQATLRKAEQVARAALAPADPSATDQRVAASAQALASKARFEIAQLAANKIQESRAEAQARNTGEEVEEVAVFESSTSFSGTRLRSALATDATDQVGGQVSASA
ncbi:MAG: hypothetical protein COA74_16245 [Gammaproteobacteria bacterium]|nr:MAG: hypothetical protein COA74_16245 [Gammaproteobacteria bacterium]